MSTRILFQRAQKGQALILIILAIIGLLGMTALAVDSANAYADRRKAQSSSDNASLAAALASVNGGDLDAAALSIAHRNGFPDGSMIVQNPPGPDCSGSTPDPVNHSDTHDKAEYYIQVLIHSSVETYFGPIIGITELHSCVSAIARGKPALQVIPFNGNAVVGLDPNGTSINTGSNAVDWKIKGGGIFSNNNADDSHKNVNFPENADADPTNNRCTTVVGSLSSPGDFSETGCVTQHNTDLKYTFPDDITPMLPPTPSCDGTAAGGINIVWPKSGDVTYAPPSGEPWVVYCITDVQSPFHANITSNNVVFYVVPDIVDAKCNGGCELVLSAPASGPYAGLVMFSHITPTPMTQQFEFRGNGNAGINGTVFLPSAWIDGRGNSGVDGDDTQLVGYQVTSNGTGALDINFNDATKFKAPEPAEVELTR